MPKALEIILPLVGGALTFGALAPLGIAGEAGSSLLGGTTATLANSIGPALAATGAVTGVENIYNQSQTASQQEAMAKAQQEQQQGQQYEAQLGQQKSQTAGGQELLPGLNTATSGSLTPEGLQGLLGSLLNLNPNQASNATNAWSGAPTTASSNTGTSFFPNAAVPAFGQLSGGSQ